MKYRLIQTCGACPEQYDVFIGTEQVGYIRVRHGQMTVRHPHSYGDVIFQCSIQGDGRLELGERDKLLRMAVAMIELESVGDLEYEVEYPR